jgi:hypothetical protein
MLVSIGEDETSQRLNRDDTPVSFGCSRMGIAALRAAAIRHANVS